MRDRRSGQAEALGQLLVVHAEAIEVVLEPLGLFDRVEVGALDVFGEGRLEHLLIVEIDHVDGHGRQARIVGGPQTAFAGDELVMVADGERPAVAGRRVP